MRRKRMQEKVNNIIHIVCEVVGLNPLNLNADYRALFGSKECNVLRDIATARQLVHYVMHCELGYSVTFVAKTTGTKRDSVFRNVRKAKGFLGIDRNYKKLLERIKERINNERPIGV